MSRDSRVGTRATGLPGPDLTPPPTAPASGRLDGLRAITRRIATADDLPTVLQSITSALVEHTGADLARVALYLADEECDVCRALGAVGARSAGGVRRLHHVASAGEEFEVAGPDHIIPLTIPTLPGKIALERRPWLSNDLQRELPVDLPPENRAALLQLGYVAIGGYPLDFRGELLGVHQYVAPLSPRVSATRAA